MDHRRDAVTGSDDLFATFSTRLAAAGGIALRAESLEDTAQRIAGILASTRLVALDLVSGAEGPTSMSPNDGAGGTIWASSSLGEMYPDLIDALEQHGCNVRVPDDPAAVRDEPLGLAIARMGIAETGSVLLHEPIVANRSVSLMTDVLVVLCPLDALRPSLDDAAPVLRKISHSGASYATLVTGPSRTADIERQLTVGVQGPGEMHVIFVPDTSSQTNRHSELVEESPREALDAEGSA